MVRFRSSSHPDQFINVDLISKGVARCLMKAHLLGRETLPLVNSPYGTDEILIDARVQEILNR